MTRRIVKSAYHHARAAGFSGSLKQWAEAQIDNTTDHARHCIAWLANKAKQRKPSRACKAVHSHSSVHDMQVVRSTANTVRGDAAKAGYSAREGR